MVLLNRKDWVSMFKARSDMTEAQAREAVEAMSKALLESLEKGNIVKIPGVGTIRRNYSAPRSQFVGVWTALEDIDPSSGPLQYVKGAHRYRLAPEDVLAHVRTKHTHLTPEGQIDRALYRYNDQVMLHAADHGELTPAPQMKRGDVAIWHAELPHGGSPATDPMRSRWSMVVHCMPEAVQGHEYKTFFTHEGEAPPPDRYAFREAHDRKVAYIGDPTYATQ